ncbi:mitochondrial import inner membrane translocase subunit Tim9-like [Pecten maximus]|uniref:mitochondrial import inner membrane translocase subunit Tim9-like n=1 Tax=Pecten maximus TaxID=6579 RepID=UPI001458775B|nr:mitochondrial import inner membrane translocase subunit Tim9-like [Pecten maximus]XP_033735943.1 mitochondrial import inner membrane translocase subunit Tim9-like [Pecten maximus]
MKIIIITNHLLQIITKHCSFASWIVSTDFTTRKASPVETFCASNCFQNYIDVSKRVDLKAIEWRKRQVEEAGNVES